MPLPIQHDYPLSRGSLHDFGITVDKQPSVIEFGTKYTKFGFIGEPSPRCIIPSEVTLSDTNETRKLFSYTSEEDLYYLLVELIHALYYKFALTPKGRRVVIVESLLASTLFKDTLAKVLFDHYHFAVVTFVPSHLVSIYTLAISSGLVIDVGHEEAVVIPVFENFPVLKGWQGQSRAAKAVEEHLKSLLIEDVEQNSDSEEAKKKSIELINKLSDSTLEDIRVRCCFVTTYERSLLLAEGKEPKPCPPSVDYYINGDTKLIIPGSIREKAYETIFQKDGEQNSLPNMVLDSILQCSIDARKKLAENLIIIGGTSMALGFKPRLDAELKALIKVPAYNDKLFLTTFKYHTPPTKANCVTWLGGSIFGATESCIHHAVTKENYNSQATSYPDWSNYYIRQMGDLRISPEL
nr:PREDICTED: actin-related protein 10 [Bemisia tabaci]